MIRVTRLTPPFASDTSDATLEITTQPLTVIAPQGGDDWVVGTQQLIRWGGTGVGAVGIDLSRDSGDHWETIIPRTPNDGAQFWTVTGPPTFGALIRVVGLDDLPGIDFSDPFTISSGTLDLSQPNGGERWAIGCWSGQTGDGGRKRGERRRVSPSGVRAGRDAGGPGGGTGPERANRRHRRPRR